MDKLPIKNGILRAEEDGTLEFKSAAKGLPRSMWETYSAFANTFGGTIVLGVDNQTHAVEGVSDADRMIQTIWDSLNNPQIVNRNILYADDIRKYDADGKTLIIVTIPRAECFLRPVYYKSLETGTFKRNGEGDFRCSMLDIAAMFRDQMSGSYDTTVLEKTSFDHVDLDTLHGFRNEMKVSNPDHMWNDLSDEEFLRVIGGIGLSSDALTVAGLLMFGKEYAINACFPSFKLDYIEYLEDDTAWLYRKVTGDGSWNGNIYNFFNTVRSRISSEFDRPLVIGADMRRVIDTDVHKAVRECLLNTLIHADYLGDLVVKICRYQKQVVLMNSGLFRIPLETAEKGGSSDPRNKTIAKMFSLIGLVERAGVGVNFICNTWRKYFGIEPTIIEDVEKQCVTFKLPTEVEEEITMDELIVEMIAHDPAVSAVRMATELKVSVPTVKNHLKAMKDAGIIRRVGGTRGVWEVV
jgi:predicted HTH transcriptional regulator